MRNVNTVARVTGLAWRARRRFSCWRAVRRAAAGSAPPVLIYQMAKGASTTVLKALERAGVNAFQVHFINPDTARRLHASVRERGLSVLRMDVDLIGGAIHRGIIRPGRSAKVINLVREPVGRNIAAYFQVLDALWQTERAHEQLGLEKLIVGFYEKFSHDRALEWFDEEFKPMLGVDVYEHEFPRDSRCLRIRRGPYDILLMRVDLDDVSKEKHLSEFLGVEGIKLLPENVGAEKPYAATYREFLRALRLPEEYVDRMLDSRYARHFFTPEERGALRSKWLGAGAQAPGA
jgi:hypothetical protein